MQRMKPHWTASDKKEEFQSRIFVHTFVDRKVKWFAASSAKQNKYTSAIRNFQQYTSVSLVELGW